MLGRNHSVRNTPVSSRTTKLHRATSPSMKDQWSGKTLRRLPLAALARPSRSSAQVPAAPTLDGLSFLAAFVPLMLPGPRLALTVSVISDHPRSQKLGPTGSVKSLEAIR